MNSTAIYDENMPTDRSTGCMKGSAISCLNI